MKNYRLLAIVVMAFVIGTITSGTLAFAEDKKDPMSMIVGAINNLSTTIANKQTTVTVNAPQGPPGPAGPQGPPGSGSANMYIARADQPFNGQGQILTLTALCNSGDKATGGGFSATDSTYAETLLQSFPASDDGINAKGWTVIVKVPTTQNAIPLSAYATCIH